MSELENMRNGRNDFRRHLLASVSALALAGFIGLRDAKADEDAARPAVWMELGGQLERIDSAASTFTPPFVNMAPPVDHGIMTTAQQSPDYSIGGEAKIDFAPEGTDWVFSAAVRYGRTNGAKHLHHQTPGVRSLPTFINGKQIGERAPELANFSDGQANNEETNLVADFQAGRDVGLGLFGGGSSIVSAGVRFAQFTSKTDATLHAEQGLHKITYTGTLSAYRKFTFYGAPHHIYTAVFQAERNTHAVGPSLSWDASLPVAGSDNGMSVAVDWGASAAILFGRQRTKSHHQTEGRYKMSGFKKTVSSYAIAPPDQNRSRFVTIPNVGGYLGVTLQKSIVKINFGYRGDFFFGAMDGGIDAAKKENVGFYGPFASVSVGIGG